MRTRLANLPPEKRKKILEKYAGKNSAKATEKQTGKIYNNSTTTGNTRRRVVSARKNAVIVALCLISLALVFAVTYGFYASRIAGWGLTVSIQSFSFSLNGRECDNGTEVTSNDLRLAKGQESDFVLAVEAKGFANNRFCVPYQLNISFKNNDKGLAPAIEVYEYSDGEYVFVSMLDEFIGSEQGGKQFGDISTAPYTTATTGINGATYYRYKFVYSEAAGDSYEDATFTLEIRAEHKDPAYINNRYYIYTSSDIAAAANYINGETANPCLTLVLLNDITVPDDQTNNRIDFNKKTGIDLNGYTLNTGNNKILITDNDTYAKGTPGYELAVKNSGTTGGLDGQGIEYSSTGDVMLVGDNLADSAKVTVSTAATSELNASFASHLSDNLEKACATPLSWTGNTASADISSGIKKYISAMTVAASDDSDKISFENSGAMTFTGAEEMTINDYVQFTVGTGAAGVTVRNYVTVIGTSPMSIAVYYAGKIPALINSSLFLPVYDAASGSTLTWVSDNEEIINSDGVFVPSGYAALDDWTNRTINLGVIVGTGDDKYTKFIAREAEILSAEERTRIIYTYPQLILIGVEGVDGVDGEDGFVSSINIEDGMNGVVGGLSAAEVRSRLGYIAAKVNVAANDTAADKNINTNINYTGENDAPFYVTYDGTVYSYDNYAIQPFYKEIKCSVKPQSLGALVVPCTVTVYFDRSATDNADTCLAFDVPRDIMVLGKSAMETLSDATVALQDAFTNNGYTDTENSAYSFLADGSYDNGKVLVDYNLRDAAWSNRVEIVNGIYIEDSEGNFVRNADGTFRLREQNETAGTIFYSRQSLVFVKPEYVGTETETCMIEAKLLSNTAQGESSEYVNTRYLDVPGTSYLENWINESDKIYVLDKGEQVVYNLSLVVEGLYHNRADEIADSNLWLALLDYYDVNGDDYISVNEAKSENIAASSVDASSTTGNNTPYQVLNLSGLGITSIKGIEYFENITGLDFNSIDSTRYNSIINITYLNSLYKLKYLGLKNNSVTDISSLQYLDSLEYIDLSNTVADTNTNSIADITPLKYLPAVRCLNLDGNLGVNDISALENHTSLRCLRLVGCSATDQNNTYYLTLVFSGCKNNFAGVGNSGIYTGNDAYSPDQSLQDAALALKNLDVINETFNTINFNTVVINGSTYSFKFASGTQGVLDFYSDAELRNSTSISTNWGKSTAWKIISPNVDTNVNVSIYVTAEENPSAMSDYFSTIIRSFNVNVLQLSGHSNMTYIEDTQHKVHVASSLVPDGKLIALLFEGYNDTKTGTVYIVKSGDDYIIGAENDEGAVAISEANIITQTEIAAATKIRDWNNRGITDLTGIEAFSAGITSLNLTGNIINEADISPLASLANLSTLYLSGQKYDFTQLSAFSETTDITSGYIYADRTYTASGMYGTGLTSLEYLSVFGCYGLDDNDTLAALYQVYLMNKNVKIYKDAAYTGVDAPANVWKPYQLPLARYFCSLPTEFSYCTLTTGANDYHTKALYVDTNGALYVNAVEESGAYHYSFNFYGVRTISFTVTGASKKTRSLSSCLSTTANGTSDTTTGVTGFRYTKLAGYTDTAYILLTLSGREGVSFSASIGRNDTVSGVHFTEHYVDFNYHIRIKINAEDAGDHALNELFPGRSLIAAIIGKYSETGTDQKTYKLSNLTGVYDASTENIVFTLGSNRINIVNNPNNDAFESTGLFLTGGISSIQGIEYTNVEILQINREAILGDGTWLKNIKQLYIGYSAVDLSTITKTLTNLTSLTIGVYKANNTKRECWIVNMYDAGEYNISDTSSDIYKCIVGLNPLSENYAAITGGTKNPEPTDYLGASLQKEAYFNTDTTGADATALYAKLREIAESKDASDHYYFYLNYMPNLTNLYIRDTNVFDWTGLLAFMFRSNVAPQQGETDYYNAYYDSNAISTINIYGSSGSGFKTYNSNGGIAEPIIRKLYYASTSYAEASPSSTTVNDTVYTNLSTTPTYKIGSFTDNKATDTYHPKSFVKSGTVTTGWHDQQYTHWETGDISYDNYFALNGDNELERIKRTEAAEADEFKNYILDFGVRLGSTDAGTQHFLSQTQTVAAGSTVYLPKTTRNASFGSDTPEEFKRSFAVSWSNLGDAVTLTESGDYYTYTLNPAQDTYVVFVGVCNGITKYYPVLFTGTSTHTVYSNIPDLQTRLFVYIASGMDNNPTSIPALVDSADYKTFYYGMTSLDGIETLGVTSINIQDNTISDISTLSSLSGLTSVNLKNNLVSDASALNNLPNLTSLNLSNNSLCKTYDGTGTYFPSSLESLDISKNKGIVAADIAELDSLTALTALTMNGTGASNDMNALYAVRDILAAQTNGSIALKFSSDTVYTATTAGIASVINILDGNTGTTEYNNLVNPTGGSYYSFNTSVAWNSAAFGNVTVTILNPSIYSGSTYSKIKGTSDYVIDYVSKFSVLAVYGANGEFSVVKYAWKQNPKMSKLVIGETDIAYAELDPEIYAYILNVFGGTINTGNNSVTITIPADADKKIVFAGTDGAGIKSLMGLEKVTFLNEISITGSSSLPVVLDGLGFAAANPAITSFKLLSDVVISESGLSGINTYLTGLTTLDLSGCHGINYTSATGLAGIIAAMTKLTDIKINSEVNYLTVTSQVGASADKYYVDGGSFGGKLISDYNKIDIVNAVKSDGTQIALLQRCGNSKALSSYYYWQGNVCAVKSASANAISGKFTDWASVLSYLSDMTVSGARVKLPDHIYEADFTGLDPAYPQRNVAGVFSLPKSFSFLGDSYAVTWSMTVKNNNTTVTRQNLLSSAGTFATITFSSGMFTGSNCYVDGDVITLTGTFTVNGTAKTKSYDISVTVDQPPQYYKKPSEQKTITEFYLELEDGEIVSANRFFDSYRLLYWIYNRSTEYFGYYNGNTLTSVAAKTIQAGKGIAAGGTYTGKYLTLPASAKYLTYEQIMSVTVISIQSGTSEDAGIGVASIKGIELFKNLREFSMRQGYIISIGPLKNMKLTKFSYNNSDNNNTNTIIQDWTPLYNSRNTLTEFTYMFRPDASLSVYPDDFSFLLGFGTQLSTVNIGKVSTIPTTVSDDDSSINRLSAFKYMLAKFLIDGRNMTFSYKSTPLYTDYKLTAAADIDSDMLGAAQILSEFAALDEAGFLYKNDFELFFRHGFGSGTDTSAVLPGYINHGGVKYPIEWQSMSSFAHIDYQTAAGVSIDVGSSENPSEDTYFTSEVGTSASNKWVLTLSDRKDNSITNAHIVARVKVGDTIYERMFTVNCSDENEYPQITLGEGYASHTLGSGSFTAYNSSTYYTIVNNGKTLLLNSTAVGNEVYVNVDGVKTRIYFDVDASFFTATGNYSAALRSDATADMQTAYPTSVSAKARLDYYAQIPVSDWLYLYYTITDINIGNVFGTVSDWYDTLQS